MLALMALFMATVFLAYANGANDNFKGVATLFGGNIASYKVAITFATCATLAGSLSSLALAQNLMMAFSGRGLLPDAVIETPAFVGCVAIGAASTVMLATVTGFPISTTHGLVGAIMGAGCAAVDVDTILGTLGTLGASFIAPLLVSPFLAICVTVPLYRGLHRLRELLGITMQSCICVQPGCFVPASPMHNNADLRQFAASPPAGPFILGRQEDCVEKYQGSIFGLSVQTSVNMAHYFSAGAVCFARGLNDTPKILALLLVVQALDIRFGVVVSAAAMAVGGLVNARKVAYTMSKRITWMNDGQALTANVVTAILVIFASRLGLPVSTTHVSVGAITGVGLVNGTADRVVISGILISWVLTLPIAAAIAAASYAAIQSTN